MKMYKTEQGNPQGSSFNHRLFFSDSLKHLLCVQTFVTLLCNMLAEDYLKFFSMKEPESWLLEATGVGSIIWANIFCSHESKKMWLSW